MSLLVKPLPFTSERLQRIQRKQQREFLLAAVSVAVAVPITALVLHWLVGLPSGRP